MAPCAECGALTEWNDDAASLICTQCGTLADPSQTTLTDSVHLNPTFQAHNSVAAPAVLKSFRTQGHSLAGQSSESRDAKNHFAMAQFITSLAVSINAAGLSPRATVLFTQAMAAGAFRWGRKAKLVAGASLVVALREYRRPDSLNDIAYLLDVQPPTLVRTLTSIISLLNLAFTPVDPSIHIEPLLARLSSLVSADAPVVSQVKTISLRAAANTATSLCTLVTRLGPDHPLNSLPSPPTAAAIFLLALEAESRSIFSHLAEIAQALGSSGNKNGRGAIMARYKLVQDEICLWIDQVPWLRKYEKPADNGNKRAKTGKRLIVARGIADVVQFQEEIWHGKLRPTVQLDMGDDKDDDEEPETVSTPEHNISPLNASRPSKRQKVAHHPLRDATQFLLNPLSGPLPDCEYPSPPPQATLSVALKPGTLPHSNFQAQGPSTPTPFQTNAHHSHLLTPTISIPVSVTQPQPTQSPPQPRPFVHHRPSLPSYILTVPSTDTLRSKSLPTRLQLLTAVRGTADDIDDDELFGDGELEGLIRPPEEAAEVGKRLEVLGILGDHSGDRNQEKVRKGKERGNGERKGRCVGGEGEEEMRKSRVDLDALARFLEDTGRADIDSDKDDDVYSTSLLGLEAFSDKEDEDEDGDEGSSDVEESAKDNWHSGLKGGAVLIKRAGGIPARVVQGDEGEVVDEWRPLSPEAGAGAGYAGYEEEYD